VRYVENENGIVPVEAIKSAVDDKTVALAISHVVYVNGFRHDLKALAKIAHEHGAYLVVDAIQSLGAVPVDVQSDEVDFLTASCYKWLLGPAGAGYLYVKKEHVEDFEPIFVGWASMKPAVFETVDFWDIWQLQLSETASRYELGAPSFVSYVGARAAIQLLLDVGIENIHKRVLDLTDMLIENVKELGLQLTTPEGKPYRSGIVHFHIDNAKAMETKMNQTGIIISARSNGLRVAPHFYNTAEEINRFIQELKPV
jgi:selenocysteine lyase/cysteine desulfurase